MLSQTEVYISVDIEADGPIPGDNSLLSIGAVAFDHLGDELSSFSVNLRKNFMATPDYSTTQWWKENKEAYKATRKDTIFPRIGMKKFVNWVNNFDPKTPVFVGYPANWDWMWIQWYCAHYVADLPFKYGTFDIKTLMCVLSNNGFVQSNIKNAKIEWTKDIKFAGHVALDDARAQGILFFRLMKEINAKLHSQEIIDGPRTQ